MDENTIDSIDAQVEEVLNNSDTSETPAANSETANSDTSETQAKTEPEQEQKLFAGKYKTVEELENGYSELQNAYGTQANELGDLRKKLNIENQRITEEQEKEKIILNAAQKADFLVNEFSKYLDKTDYPETVKELLTEYKVRHDSDLLESIKGEFPREVLESVARQEALFDKEQEYRQEQERIEGVRNDLNLYLQQNFADKQDRIAALDNSPALYSAYAELFKTFGANLNTDKFFEIANNIKADFEKEFAKKYQIKLQNDTAIDKLAATAPANSHKSVSSMNLNEMSPEEIDREVSKYI